MSRIEKGGPRFRPGAPGAMGIQRRQQANVPRPGHAAPSTSASSSSAPTQDASNTAADDASSETSERHSAPLAPTRPPSIGPSRPPSTTKSFAIINKAKKPPRPISIGMGMGDADAPGTSSRPAPPASLSRTTLPAPPTTPITPAPESLRSGSVPPASASRRSATPSMRPSASPAPERRRRDSTASAAAGPSGTTPAPSRPSSDAPPVGTTAPKRTAPSDMGPPVSTSKRQKAAITPGEPADASGGRDASGDAASDVAADEAPSMTATERATGAEEPAASPRRRPRATAAEKKKKQGRSDGDAEAGPSRPARRAKEAATISPPAAEGGLDGEADAAQRPASSDDDYGSDEYTPRRRKSLASRGGRRSTAKGKDNAAQADDESDSGSSSDTGSDDDAEEDEEEDEGTPERARKGKAKAGDAAGSTQKRTAKRRRLPSSAPRRPPSSYFLFANQKRPELQADHPELSFREVTTRTGEAWRALSQQDKAAYEDTAKQRLEDWKAAVEGWKLQHPNWEAEAEAEASTPKKATGRPRKKGKTYRDGEPKRPPSAYMLFCAGRRKEKATARAEAASQGQEVPADWDSATFMKEAGKAWKELSAEARAPFDAEAKKLRDEYNVAIDAWEEAHPSAFEDSDGEEDGASTDAGSTKRGRSGSRGRSRSRSRSRSRRRRKRRRAEGSGLGRKRTKRVSDDEAEYQGEIAEHGEELRNRKLNARTTSMADLSVPELSVGRAGPRTFQLRRVYRELQDKRRAELKQIKLEGEAAALNPGRAAAAAAAAAASAASSSQTGGNKDKGSASASQAPAAPRRAPADDDDGVELVGDIEGSGDDEDTRPSRRARASRHDDEDDDDADGRGSARGSDDDAESVGGQSAASHMSFKENRFAVRVRQVNGQIVIDESSLHANFGEGVEDEGHEFVEENDREKFITSATRGKRKGTERWDREETEKFLKAVQMWGTDFEMIARLFPRRNRKQIKAKWRSEERSNADRLHAAFNKPQKVDLEQYGATIGVDFSGPPPEIKAKKPPLADDDEGAGPGSLFDAKMESMEQTMGIRKTSQTPQPHGAAGPSGTRSDRASSRAGSASAASAASGVGEDDDDDEDLPVASMNLDVMLARRQAQFRKSQHAQQGRQAGSGGGASAGGQGRKRSNSASSRGGKGKENSRGSAASSGNRSSTRRRAEEDNVEIVGDI